MTSHLESTVGRSQHEKMAGIWANVLDHQEFGVSDNFFDVGGHSLVVTRLAIEIEQAFGVSVPVDAIFDQPTIESLCAYISKKS
ncbi:Acyl carrier protein [Paraburkholderia steynii]|uniref:Acyl carrier protein n=1 Tax=Paraburkholderia steynii TaxID=1245441 RepID=A0A7Z7FRE7_9BURK|nr:phosphopantetheine-binding protein [Paraburkholderia steynii]SDJ53511.1 Acyl carrier protein [Paraburkholderia steynii]